MRIAHLSDPHLGPLPRPPFAAMLSKRALGYLNWVRSRKRALDTTVLDRLVADIRERSPDHIAVTGDLVNIAMAHEYETGAQFLQSLGASQDITCVPGNHDAYVPGALAHATTHWAAFMSGDDGEQRFPFVRRRGDIALIGVSTAVATPPFSARGRVGNAQLERLRAILDKTDDAYKIVLIHHPPDRELTPTYRALADAQATREVLAEGCVDLVLHGHNHKASEATLPTARGSAHVIGVPSASSDGHKHEPAGYGLIDIDLTTRTARLTRYTMANGQGGFQQTARIDL